MKRYIKCNKNYKTSALVNQLFNLLNKHNWKITRATSTYAGKYYVEAWNPAEDCHLEMISEMNGDQIVSKGAKFYIDGEIIDKKEIPSIIKDRADMSGYTTYTVRPNIGASKGIDRIEDDEVYADGDDPYHGYRWYFCDCGYEDFHPMDEDEGVCPRCHDHTGGYNMASPEEAPELYEDITPDMYNNHIEWGYDEPDYYL